MEQDSGSGVCVICGKVIESKSVRLSTASDQHPERTYSFWVHPDCLKAVANRDSSD
jgi:hypothetical protein